MMKTIDVPFMEGVEDLPSFSTLLADFPLHKIDNSPWPKFKSTAKANFAIAHNGNAILLKYEVQEQVLKSVSRDFNDQVHKDNCVEFFIGFGNEEKAYYNIELNCLGSIKIGYGKGRGNRTALDAQFLEQVKRDISINYKLDNGHSALKWQLSLSIPKEVFCYDSIISFEGLGCRANFYKCGDDLPEPHFLSWSMVHTNEPDFHRPEYFGQLNFLKHSK